MNAVGLVTKAEPSVVPPQSPASGVDFILVRPGATVLDELGCIKGDLDVPLSASGRQQAAELAAQLDNARIAAIYSSPCTSAVQTAEAIAARAKLRIRIDDDLKNLCHGLWQGKRFEELRQTQPKTYRMWAEHPESISPPGGETITHAESRARQFARRLVQRHRSGVVVIVVSEPFTTILRGQLCGSPVSPLPQENFWNAERRTAGWELVHVELPDRPR
jgi:broad specificity phosphatase PhoE